jgi:hypothetical protein
MSDERIARLEAQREGDQATLEGLSDKFDAMAKDVQEIKQTIAGQKGYFRGVTTTVVAAWSVVLLVLQSLWDKFAHGNS